MLSKIKLFDLDFVSEDDFKKIVVEIFNYRQNIQNDQLPFVSTPNVDQVVKLNLPENELIKIITQKAFIILPDGQPIVWTGQLLGKKIKKRLPGSDLFPLLWDKINESNKKSFMILPFKEVGDFFQKNNNNLEIYVPPFFNLKNDNEFNDIVEKCTEKIKKSYCEFVFIGLGFPKQEILSHKILLKLLEENYNHIPLFLFLGASFEFYAGLKKRAPLLWQKMGLEWLYRFFQEPKRMFKRYFIDDLKFLKLITKEFLKEKNIHPN